MQRFDDRLSQYIDTQIFILTEQHRRAEQYRAVPSDTEWYRSVPYQLILVVVELGVGLVALDEFLHELEVLDAELVLVVHELDILLADAALHRRRHLHLRRAVVCRRRRRGGAQNSRY